MARSETLPQLRHGAGETPAATVFVDGFRGLLPRFFPGAEAVFGGFGAGPVAVHVE
jgi:hypothetical protein